MKKILLLFIIVFSFSACITIYTNLPGYQENRVKQSDFEKRFQSAPRENILINSEIGDFSITGFNKKEVIIKGSKSSDIGEFLNDIDINIIKKGKTVFFNSNIYNKIINSVNIDCRIQTPFETNIQSEIGRGSVTMKSIRGNIKINGRKLDLNLTDISGKLIVSVEAGKVRLVILEWDKNDNYIISNINGDIEFYAPKEALLNIQAKGIKGNIKEKHKFKKGGAKVVLETKRGKIIIDKI